MLLAEAAAAATESRFNGFDIFMILFTIVIFIGVVRLIMAPEKNKFAIGFSIVVLLVFIFTDAIMIANWFDLL